MGARLHLRGTGLCLSSSGLLVAVSHPGDLFQSALFAAFFSYGQALLVRFKRPTWFWTRFEFAIGAFAVVCWLIVVREDLRSQLAIGDASLAVLLAISIVAVWKHARSPIDRMLVGTASLVVAETVVRVAVLLASTSAGDFASLDQFFVSDYAFLMQVFASIVGFVMALTVLGSVVVDVVTGHRRAAEHDPLTDLLNRRGFEQALPQAVDGAFPAGAVIIGDIDHFKQVNDRFGHAAGDHVIIGFAERLKASFKNASAIARFGGEEFVTFLPDVSRADAADMAEEARLAFEALDWSGQGVLGSITASFGVSTTAPGDHSVHDAIARADACLYVAKNAGRNRVISEGQRPPDSPPTLRVVS
ncbi:GGDEF domain-containing protein [Aliirhizobium terrae]|uniref:GGDEF domain-containing protein n=1 Tax=Terrirhizobium terrae TaxID=2926709 RepID=UPI003369C05D